MLWISFAVIVAAVVFDLRSREIPDTLSVCLLAIGICSSAWHFTNVGWLSMAAGLTLGFAVGAVLFWAGGFGGGDVKLLASLGTVLGWRGLLGAMFWIAVIGAALAVIAGLRKQKEFPYAPAFALGYLAFIVQGYWQ